MVIKEKMCGTGSFYNVVLFCYRVKKVLLSLVEESCIVWIALFVFGVIMSCNSLILNTVHFVLSFLAFCFVDFGPEICQK